VITHQDAAALFAANNFICTKARNTLKFDGVQSQIATLALIAS
jgi:hypothetical protein